MNHEDAARDQRLPRVIVAGMGLVSPLGVGLWPTFRALLAGRTMADRTATLAEQCGSGAALEQVDLVRAVGAVSVAQHVACDPAVELAERAAREACMDAGVKLHEIADQSHGPLPCYIGTSKGAVHAWLRAFDALRQPHQRHVAAPAIAPGIALGPHGYLNHELTRRMKVQVHRHVVAACASSLTALHLARQSLIHAKTSALPKPTIESKPTISPKPTALRRGLPMDQPYCLVLTAEAALLPLFIHSYRRLGVLAPLTLRDYRGSPLDQHRRGFMLSELGAAVLLKRLEPDETPAAGDIELLDTAVAGEGYDMIRPDPCMASLEHVASQLLHQRTLDVLHPHAPGTAEHDATELDVMHHVLARTQPGRAVDVYACKGALGHGLGAAGLVAMVLACQCLRTGARPAMPWLQQPIDTRTMHTSVRRDEQPCDKTGTHAIFAAGFGGHVAGAVVRGR